MTKTKGRFGIIDTIFCLIILLAAGWVYKGFFSPDPLVVRPGDSNLIHAALLVLFPAAVIGILALYWGVRTKRMPGSGAALLIGTVVVLAFLLFPVITWWYYKNDDSAKLAQYHPYLQLTPHEHADREAPADAPAYRIFCLGGSTTEWADTRHVDWPSRVEQELAGAMPGRTVQVYNDGRQWYTSQHSLINYVLNLRRHKPDAIIVMHALNDLLINADFCRFSNGAFQNDYRHFYGPVTRLIKRETMFEALGDKLCSQWNYPSREVVNTVDFPGLEPFKRNLQNLIDIARMDNVKVILMTEPYLFKDVMSQEELAQLGMLNTEAIGPDKQWSLQTALRGMKLYDDAIRELSKQEGVYLIDLETEIPKTIEYFADDVHYRDAAFPMVADYVAGELKRQGIVAPTATE